MPEDLVKAVLFEQTQFCPLCGLLLFTSFASAERRKYCPEGDGTVSIGESDNGLPAVIFEARR